MNGREKMEDRFEDVPQELDELDRAGYVKIKSYHSFYQHLLFYPDRNDNLQPAGMSSNHKDYI
jgi:hypothetical protein